MSQDDITSAHSVRGIPPSEILIPFPSIRSLVNSQSQRYGDRIFLIAYRGEDTRIELSYKEFSRKVFQGANYLRDRSVQFGDRVIPASTGGLSALLEIFSTWTVGASAILGLTPDKGKKESEEFETTLEEFDHHFRTGKKSRIDDDVLLVYPRDRNGTPKGVRLTQYNLLVEAMAAARRQEISEQSVVLCGLPIADANGLAGCVMPTLYEGGTLVLPGTLSEMFLSHLMEREKPTVVFAGRPFLDYLGGTAPADEVIPSSLDHLTAAVDDVTLEILEETSDVLDGRLVTGLALPEASSFASFTPLPGRDESLLSQLQSRDAIPAGTALDAAEMTVLDEAGNQLPEHKHGEIVVRGHTVMKGYMEDDRATADAFRYGWFHTGIRGFYLVGTDGKQYIYITPDHRANPGRVGSEGVAFGR